MRFTRLNQPARRCLVVPTRDLPRTHAVRAGALSRSGRKQQTRFGSALERTRASVDRTPAASPVLRHDAAAGFLLFPKDGAATGGAERSSTMFVPRGVAELVRFASTESNRSLDSVTFDRDPDGRPWACASNGHQLVAYRWTEPPADAAPAVPESWRKTVRKDFSETVSTADVKRLAAAIPKGAPKPVAYFALNEAKRPPNDMLEAAEPHRGGRPEAEHINTRPAPWPKSWREYVPDYTPKRRYRVAISARYIRTVMQAFERLTGSQNEGYKVIFDVPKHPLQAVKITGVAPDGSAEVVAVIMPLRLAKEEGR